MAIGALIEVGPAHTPGDTVVHVPDAGVVFAAEVLFVDATPVMWFGPLEGWLKTTETLLSLDAEIYVPGHGPPGGRAPCSRCATTSPGWMPGSVSTTPPVVRRWRPHR